MTDPDAAAIEPQEAADAAPPPRPPRPQGRPELTQLEADELYARQLAEHYDNVGAYESRTSNQQRQGRSGQRPSNDDEREYSFIDDELPLIRDNLRQGFFETQTKVNGWLTTLKKRIEDSFDETEEPHGQGRRPGEPSTRKSGDYDADPQVLGDDFAGMRLSADGSECPVSHFFQPQTDDICRPRVRPPIPPLAEPSAFHLPSAERWPQGGLQGRA